MATFREFIKSIQDDGNDGKDFEHFCKWFLEHDPEWSKTVDKVWLWDEYPNKWQRQDLGTDLVFRDNEGLIWAVQAKCYSEHRTTTKGDVNSFLADTGRKEVDRRLWLQTTNKMEARAEKTLKGQDKPVTVFNLNDFCDAQIDYPNSFAELYQAKVRSKPKPDTHQIEAIEAVKSELRSLDRGQMIMACGTGKTFTTLWIKEALNAHTTLVLLPSLSLLSQTMREWAWAGNTDFKILNVCSDKSVGKKTEDMDPSDAPFPVTSEVTEIAEFLKNPEPKVVFCTYQSSPLIAEVQLDASVPAFDLTVADEAHRCAGKADAGFATVLDADKIRSTKRLFTTATPRYFGAAIRDEAKARDLAVVGMDNEEVFGPVVHKLTFGEAIQRELLSDYRVVIVGVDEPTVKHWIDEQEIVAINPDEDTDARTLAAKIGLIKAIKDYDLKRVISFHSRVNGARKFAEELVDVVNLIEPTERPEGKFLADYVSGKMKAGDRKDKIDRLKVLEGYDRGILTNARCLAEGVDVPSLDGVAFIDPRGSQVEIIQAVGRAIRKVRGAKVQTKGTIVIPVFIEDGDDVEASIEASNFKPVWDVLKALRSHDEVLAEALDQFRTNMAKTSVASDQGSLPKIVFDLPFNVEPSFAGALRTVLVEKTTASWNFGFGLLEQYVIRDGNARVPARYQMDGFALGSWVSTQRNYQDKLTPERQEKLERLGFVWDPLTADWEEGFEHLEQYFAKNSNVRVQQHFKIDGYSLGAWVSSQRNNKGQLRPERLEKLEHLGFVWDTIAADWEEGFRYFEQYVAKHANARVPVRYKIDDYPLGTWVHHQRRKEDQFTTPEQRANLERLGFVWYPHTADWEKGFSALEQYVAKHANARVPVRYKIDDYPLGTWVSAQRGKKEKLTPEQRESLDGLGFVWAKHDAYWEEGFSALGQYVEKHGDARVPFKHDFDGFALGRWVIKQRPKKDQLTPQRREKLDGLGFVWDPHTEAWEESFSKLQQFQVREGHCKVPNLYQEDGYRLGQWVGNQRRTKDKLSPKRLKKLEAIGFVWDLLTQAWEEGFNKLQQFQVREGHCRVPWSHMEDGYRLGQWVGNQRRTKDKLSPERLKKLEALGFVWDARQ